MAICHHSKHDLQSSQYQSRSIPTLLKVANNQILALLERHSAKKSFERIFSKSRFCIDLEDFSKINSHRTAVPKRYSTLSQQPAFFQQQPAPPQPLSLIQQSAPSRSMPASISYHYGC